MGKTKTIEAMLKKFKLSQDQLELLGKTQSLRNGNFVML